MPVRPANGSAGAGATPPRSGLARQQWRPDPGSPIRALNSDQAWSAFRQQLPFLDARRSQDFQAGHVAGAHSAPVWEADLDARITEFEAQCQPGPASPIVLYCGGGDCEDSQLLARKLVALGYRNLFIYRDGYPDWTGKGRPSAGGGRP